MCSFVGSIFAKYGTHLESRIWSRNASVACNSNLIGRSAFRFQNLKRKLVPRIYSLLLHCILGARKTRATCGTRFWHPNWSRKLGLGGGLRASKRGRIPAPKQCRYPDVLERCFRNYAEAFYDHFGRRLQRGSGIITARAKCRLASVCSA